MLNRLKFNWKAQTAHGLHSPFVFALYTELIDPIYQKSPQDLETALIHGIGRYLNLAEGNLHVVDLNQITESMLPTVESLFQNSANLIICLHPHTGVNSNEFWQKLHQNPAVIHSIELFELGILSLKPTAPKQHFWLKKS
jgi:hypothetical protein